MTCWTSTSRTRRFWIPGQQDKSRSIVPHARHVRVSDCRHASMPLSRAISSVMPISPLATPGLQTDPTLLWSNLGPLCGHPFCSFGGQRRRQKWLIWVERWATLLKESAMARVARGMCRENSYARAESIDSYPKGRN